MVQEPVNEIKMNAVDLQIHSVTLTLSSGTTAQPSEINVQEAEESLTLPFADQVPEGKHQLKITFTGALNDYMKYVSIRHVVCLQEKIHQFIAEDFIVQNTPLTERIVMLLSLNLSLLMHVAHSPVGMSQRSKHDLM